MEPFQRTGNGSIDVAGLEDLLSPPTDKSAPAGMSRTESIIAALYGEILSVAPRDLSPASDFFSLGGDSMKAGRLLSTLRKEFQLRLSIDILFRNGEISALASFIDNEATKPNNAFEKPTSLPNHQEQLLPGCQESHSSTKLLLLLIQLLPLYILYPMKRAFTWTLFIYCLSFTQRLITNLTIPGRLINLVVSPFIARTVTKTFAPIVAIVTKWIVIGRYKEGLYPMWGLYHTRWWLCRKSIEVAGMGT